MFGRMQGREPVDHGFSLVELLVVVVIIGVLATVAAPVLLTQRTRAVDVAMKSDLRAIVNAEETWFADNQEYAVVSAASGTVHVGSSSNRVTLSPGNRAEVILTVGTPVRADTFCVVVSRASGAPGSQSAWVFVRDRGGLQSFGETSCS